MYKDKNDSFLTTFFICIALLLGMTLLSSCSGSLTRKQEAAEIISIKQAAVVGLAIEQPASSELSFDVGSKEASVEKGGSFVPTTEAHALAVYEDLNHALGKNLRWQMTPVAVLQNHPGYKKAYDKTMKGWQNKMPTARGKNLFLAKGIMDTDSLRILGSKGRDALLDELKVDALVVTKVNVSYKGALVMGIGQRRPQAAIMFQVFKKGKESPVWFEGNILGDEAKKSVGATSFVDEKLLNELTRESAKSAFEKIRPATTTAKY